VWALRVLGGVLDELNDMAGARNREPPEWARASDVLLLERALVRPR
jgi:hypothetical protein